MMTKLTTHNDTEKTYTFTWSGINSVGQKITGQINAESNEKAILQLQLNNIIILSIKKNYFLLSSYKKFTLKNKLDFTEQLLLLLQASIPLSDALALMANASENKNTQLLLLTLKEYLDTGMSFSAALQRFSNYFDNHYCQMILAGEKSGQLTEVLAQLIRNQTQLTETARKIKKALFYPMSILIIALIICVGMLLFVIPQFSEIYKNFGAQLPAITKEVILTSQFLVKHCVLFLLVTFSVFLLFTKVVNPWIVINKIIFRISFLKNAAITRQISVWSQIVSMGLSAKIPLIDALALANQTLLHPKMRQEFQIARESVIAGKKLNTALSSCLYFPERARYLIAIGENADALDTMMEKIATLYHQELGDTLDHLSKLIEPVIMIMVASLISGLIIAMYLPVFKMGSVL